jgi:hypothetical protein
MHLSHVRDCCSIWHRKMKRSMYPPNRMSGYDITASIPYFPPSLLLPLRSWILIVVSFINRGNNGAVDSCGSGNAGILAVAFRTPTEFHVRTRQFVCLQHQQKCLSARGDLCLNVGRMNVYPNMAPLEKHFESQNNELDITDDGFFIFYRREVKKRT